MPCHARGEERRARRNKHIRSVLYNSREEEEEEEGADVCRKPGQNSAAPVLLHCTD